MWIFVQSRSVKSRSFPWFLRIFPEKGCFPFRRLPPSFFALGRWFYFFLSALYKSKKCAKVEISENIFLRNVEKPWFFGLFLHSEKFFLFFLNENQKETFVSKRRVFRKNWEKTEGERQICFWMEKKKKLCLCKRTLCCHILIQIGNWVSLGLQIRSSEGNTRGGGGVYA